MKKAFVFDVEANGLLDDATSLHCLCGKNLVNGDQYNIFGDDDLTKPELIKLFHDCDLIIGHNIIYYDIPIIKKLLNLDIFALIDNNKIVDTYLWSRVLSPDRELPSNCPTSVLNPVTGATNKIGPHSLESWGWRVGEKKPEIYDWRVFTDEILYRCMEDVNITHLTYLELCKEAGIVPLTHEMIQ